MRIFISAGEPSGDLHAANLLLSLRRIRPDVACLGFGGTNLETAGARLLYPLANLAVMGISQALFQIITFVRLVFLADRCFREERPDAVVLIDYPGFHWWLARYAHARGIPVVWYVPPQLWAWASWRVKRIRRHVNLTLCSLPFEPGWYHERGVTATEFVGHPFFDEIAERTLDSEFLLDQSARGGPVVAILPGSRSGEIDRNGVVLLRAAAELARRREDVRFIVSCLKPVHAERMRSLLSQMGGPVARLEILHGRTPEVIRLADLAWAVSGSVSLELMAETLPTCILYKVNPIYKRIARRVLKVPYITLVNLLAGRAVMPEFLTDRDVSSELADCAEHWLSHPQEREQVSRLLAALRSQVAKPGASDRAAARILELIATRRAPLAGPHASHTHGIGAQV